MLSLKKSSYYLIIVSLCFLCYSLQKNGYLQIPTIISEGQLFISFCCLFSAFLLDGFIWFILLKQANHPISFKDAITSIGIYVFGKYIPGKIWSLLGRADFIAHKYKYDIKYLTSLSIFLLIITMWSGLLVSTLTLIYFIPDLKITMLLLPILLLATLFSCTKLFRNIVSFMLHKIFRQNIVLTNYPTHQILILLFFYTLYWLLLSIGFYLLVGSISTTNVSYLVGFLFPTSVIAGIITLFSPGGLGIREGVLTSLLLTVPINIEQAASIAVTSRLWFLVGELFIFFLAIFISLLTNKKKKLTKNHPTLS